MMLAELIERFQLLGQLFNVCMSEKRLKSHCSIHVNNLPKYLRGTVYKPDLHLQNFTSCQSCNLSLRVNCGLELITY